MNNPAMFIIFLVLGIALFAFTVTYLIRYLKKNKIKKGEECIIDNKIYRNFLLLAGSQGLFTIASTYGLVLWYKWSLIVLEHFEIIFGSYLFGSSFVMLFITFVLYYYRPTLIPNRRKLIRILMFISIPMTIIFCFVMLQGIGDHLLYPLPNAINFKYGLTNIFAGSDGFRIAFYGIVVVFGACISYFISDHYFYKKYGKHGLIDTLFLVAFPFGLIGARLWYCFVLEPSYYLSNPVKIFMVTDGGLAIQGGALLGIIAGVSFMLIFRKYVDIRFAMDVCIPTILIAQAIGRWGNFFNCEVHGLAVNMDAWRFLPNIILNQMQYSSSAPSLAGTNQIYLPLFLIESVINFGGYFIIRYLTKPINRFLPLGSQASLYIIWYGLVRIILEPFRYGYTGTTNSEGFGYSQSLITAYVMMGVGVVLIGVFYLWAFLEKKIKKLDHIKVFDFE